MRFRIVMIGAAFALATGCGGSGEAEQDSAGTTAVANEAASTEDAGSAEDVDAFEGAPGQMRVVVGDIDYSIEGLLCTIGDREFGPTGQFFVNGGNVPYTAFYAYAPLETLVNERLTVTGPDGDLFLEHKQVDGGEVLNTQIQSPGKFLFDPAAPSLDFDEEVLFTVTTQGAEPTEMLGTLSVDC